MSEKALQVVQNFQMSMGNGSSEWKALVSDNVVFKGPVDEVRGKDDFIKLNEGFFPLVKGYEPWNAFENGEFACLEGIFKISTPKGNVIELEMAEVYKVNEGQIESVRVYYDAEEFRKEFAA